jgi:hypothetical protein
MTRPNQKRRAFISERIFYPDSGNVTYCLPSLPVLWVAETDRKFIARLSDV